MSIKERMQELNNMPGLTLSLTDEETRLYQVSVEDCEEFPIFIREDDEEINCITYLFDESEVNPESRCEMLEAMLCLNIPLPLSSFGKVGPRYILYGALNKNASSEDLFHEVQALSNNTLEAIEALRDYLK